MCSPFFKQPLASFVPMRRLQFLVALFCCSHEPLFGPFFPSIQGRKHVQNPLPVSVRSKIMFWAARTAPLAPQGGSRLLTHGGPGCSKSVPTGSGTVLWLSASSGALSAFHFGLSRTPFQMFLGGFGTQHHGSGTEQTLDRWIVFPEHTQPRPIVRVRVCACVPVCARLLQLLRACLCVPCFL